jgi:hypothetical protein
MELTREEATVLHELTGIAHLLRSLYPACPPPPPHRYSCPGLTHISLLLGGGFKKRNGRGHGGTHRARRASGASSAARPRLSPRTYLLLYHVVCSSPRLPVAAAAAVAHVHTLLPPPSLFDTGCDGRCGGGLQETRGTRSTRRRPPLLQRRRRRRMQREEEEEPRSPAAPDEPPVGSGRTRERKSSPNARVGRGNEASCSSLPPKKKKGKGFRVREPDDHRRRSSMRFFWSWMAGVLQCLQHPPATTSHHTHYNTTPRAVVRSLT